VSKEEKKVGSTTSETEKNNVNEKKTIKFKKIEDKEDLSDDFK
jgi:hypothetical protein